MTVIAEKGSSHNGAVLEATKTPAQGAGIIVTLEMRAMKNWGGTSSGAAFVQMVGIETRQYEQRIIKCTTEGGADGATHTNSTTEGLFFPDVQSVMIFASMKHQDTSNWQEWQSSVENTVKDVVKGIIDTIKDPQAMIEAAKTAGMIATII